MVEDLNPKVARNYIGGRGIGIYYLLKEVDPIVDPLAPQNKLIMATGPLTGTKAPTGARYMVTTKSPLTGAITCSNSGGYFPAELKMAGYDALIFEGKAERPVYLWINGDQSEIRSAAHLWGLSTHETDVALRKETSDDAKTAVIGPAGEKLVRFAAIMNDRNRAAGRSGVGAVLGAKNVKGVVIRGFNKVPLADPQKFEVINADFRNRFKEATKDNPPPLRTHGTAITMVATQSHGVLPTRNFQEGTFGGWESIYGEALTKRFLVKPKACFGCPIACGRGTRISRGPFQGEGEGPEYETLYALGSNCGVDNLAAVTKANYICNELGLDTISMGSTIACAIELFEKGYLSEKDVEMPLRWGDAKTLIALVEQCGRREKFGDILAEGSLRLATRYGHPELAMVSKGQEFAGYEPRGEQGMGLAYATSPIGASHMRGDPAYFELLGVPFNIDPLSWKDKPQIVARWQDIFAIIDSVGLCVFFAVRYLTEPTIDIQPTGILALLNAATGSHYTLPQLEKAGERIVNAERLFLSRAGFDRKDDCLPPRIISEPLPDGPAKGMICHLEEMLFSYYKYRGWTDEGIPTDNKLKALGIL
jgi:aldehyde:ferredoxin oxidoreductase